MKPVRLSSERVSAEVGQLARRLDGACAGAFHYGNIMIEVLIQILLMCKVLLKVLVIKNIDKDVVENTNIWIYIFPIYNNLI